MLRSLQISLALMLGFTLAGCNRSPVQPAPAPSANTSYKPAIDTVPPPQDTGVRVNADRGEVDVNVDRRGPLGDRDIKVEREADGDINIKRDRDPDNTRRPLLNRDIDVKVNPGEGVKVDVDK